MKKKVAFVYIFYENEKFRNQHEETVKFKNFKIISGKIETTKSKRKIERLQFKTF